MTNITKNVYFSDLDKYGIMSSSEPDEASEFDVRGQFNINHTEATSGNSICFGVFGLANLTVVDTTTTVTQCVALRCYRGNVIQLIKVRGDWDSATVLYTYTGFTIKNNTTYWVRLVCQGGRFRAYIATNNRIWGNPIIDYTWAQSDWPVPQYSVSAGKGQCGIFGKIQPLRFGAVAIDDVSTILPVQSSGSLQNFSSWPSSGKLYFDGEYMTYGGKSGTNVPQMYILTASDNGDQYDINAGGVNCNGITDGCTIEQIYILSGEGDYSGYALWFSKGQEVNAAWKIASNTHTSGQLGQVVCYDSGHQDTNGTSFGNPGVHEFVLSAIPYSTNYSNSSTAIAYVLPCLQNVGRGQNGTGAAPHVAGTAYLFEGDVIQCMNFEAYDFSEDFNTERLLRTTCFLAGVETEFNTYDSGSAGLVGGGSWLPIFNDNYTCIDLQMSASLASGQEVGVVFRDNPAYGGFLATVSNVGGIYYANLYDSNGPTLLEQHRYHQVPTGTLDIRVVACIRIAGDIGTFVAISLNGMVHTCYNEDRYVPKSLLLPLNAYLVARGSGSVNVLSYSIPEYEDWREAVYLDPNSDAQSDLQNVIADRFVKMVSRSGEKIKFSAWDNYGTAVQVLNAQVVDDQTSQEDAEFFSYMHLEADNIHEVLDADLVANEGFRVKSFQTPLLIDDQAKASATRQLRYAHEMTDIKTLVIPADLRLENEDKIIVGYTTQGSVMTRDLTNYVISDLTFSFAFTQLDCQAGVRKWVDDTVR